MHCALHFAGATLYLADDFRERSQTAPAMSAVFVGLEKAAQVDALIENARRLGCAVTQEQQDMFWGDPPPPKSSGVASEILHGTP